MENDEKTNIVSDKVSLLKSVIDEFKTQKLDKQGEFIIAVFREVCKEDQKRMAVVRTQEINNNATPKQLAYLSTQGIPHEIGISKQEASELISRVIAARVTK